MYKQTMAAIKGNIAPSDITLITPKPWKSFVWLSLLNVDTSLLDLVG